MKTSRDPRHIKRIKVMQDLFAWVFNPDREFDTQEAKEISAETKMIDSMISKAAPAWPIDKINKIDLAVLRLAVFELTITPKEERENTPPKVIIDEAIEIAKEFGSEASPSFVNGVLGKLVSLQKISTQ